MRLAVCGWTVGRGLSHGVGVQTLCFRMSRGSRRRRPPTRGQSSKYRLPPALTIVRHAGNQLHSRRYVKQDEPQPPFIEEGRIAHQVHDQCRAWPGGLLSVITAPTTVRHCTRVCIASIAKVRGGGRKPGGRNHPVALADRNDRNGRFTRAL